MPFSHLVFKMVLHIRFICRLTITTCPQFPINCGQVEVGSSDITYNMEWLIGKLENKTVLYWNISHYFNFVPLILSGTSKQSPPLYSDFSQVPMIHPFVDVYLTPLLFTPPKGRSPLRPFTYPSVGHNSNKSVSAPSPSSNPPNQLFGQMCSRLKQSPSSL